MSDQMGNELPPAVDANQQRAANHLLSEYVSVISAFNPLDALARVGVVGMNQQMNTLINNMDSPVWRTREGASQSVTRLGITAAPYLAEALDSGRLTLEQSRRCEHALDRILRNQSLSALVSHLTDSTTPGYLQRQIRDHVISRAGRRLPPC